MYVVPLVPYPTVPGMYVFSYSGAGAFRFFFDIIALQTPKVRIVITSLLSEELLTLLSYIYASSIIISFASSINCMLWHTHG